MTGHTADSAAAKKTRRMHLNESPFTPSPHVVQAIADAARQANQYPEQNSPALLAALSAYCGAPAERIVVTSGSNELLHLLPLIVDVARFPDASMVVVEPSFPTYRKVADFFAMTVHAVPVTEAGAPDVEAVLRAITPECRLVCVPSPNNPTGGILTAEELAQLAAGVPENVLLHFDEAYYEFGLEASGVETLPLLAWRKGPWIASRSFSKAFGLAGLRLGYSVASSDELARRCCALRPNFSVNAPAQAAGMAALNEPARMHANIAALSAERERLRDGLSALGLAPLPSAANFVAFAVPGENPGTADALARTGILVAEFILPSNRSAIRATIGTAEDTDALLSALTALREA